MCTLPFQREGCNKNVVTTAIAIERLARKNHKDAEVEGVERRNQFSECKNTREGKLRSSTKH